MSLMEPDPHLLAEMPLFLWAGNLTTASSSSFPPPNPTHPDGSVPSHPCPAGSPAIPSAFPMCGRLLSAAFGQTQGGAASLPRVKGVKLCSLQRSMLTKDRHAKQLRKPLLQPVPPILLPVPRHSAAAHPGGRRLPSSLPSPCSPAPLRLQGRPPGPWL